MTTLHWIGLAVGLVVLNLSLTFTNVWPTLSIRLTGDLSVELAVVALALVLAWRWIDTRPRGDSALPVRGLGDLGRGTLR